LKRIVLTVAALCLVGVVAPATASALTRKQANTIALRTLHPQKGRKSVILFGLPAPVRAGGRVFPVEAPRSKKKRKPVARLRHATWLYWLDQVPYAKFSHPSRYLLIDDATGRVVKNAGIDWYPTVNGRPPAFVSTPKGYRSPRFRVYTRQAKPRTTTSTAPDAFAWPLATVPPGALKGDCVLIVSDFGDPQFQNDYDAFSDWARSLKIPTFFATGNGPVTTIPDAKDKPLDGEQDLRGNTTALVKKNCTDILIYMSGHGLPASEGPAKVVTHIEVDSSELIPKVTMTGITVADITRVIDANPATTFKLKIDSCYSGRFRDALVEDGPDGPRSLKNILIIENSSPATQVSSFGNPLVDGRDNPNNVSEFTNQNLTGLTTFFDSPTKVAQAVAAGGSLLARALDQAFDDGAPANHAVDEDGDPIKPQKFASLGPEVKPIHAVFNPATFTTTYTEPAPAGTWSYAWSVKFTEDEPCTKGFKGNNPQQNQAAWYHADLTQGGPCDHKASQVGPRGHKGTVTVVFSDPIWKCTATYFGTEGDGGSLMGDGSPPACVRK
jgi:hypothetical protein